MATPKKYLKLNDLSSYRISFHVSNYAWDIITEWNIFLKKTVGEQFASSLDSVSANIAEGFGRKFKKDKIKFFNYAYASALEALNWNEKAYRRNLITKSQYEHIIGELKKLPKEINNLSNFTKRKLAK